MRIGRTLPPAAAPIRFRDIVSGLLGLVAGQRELDRFEREIKAHFGVRHCFLLSSGKTALTLTLEALRELHPDRDEVLIPAFTCYSVPSSIVRAGLKVRMCDIHPDYFDFDFAKLAAEASIADAPSTITREPTPARSIAHPGMDDDLHAQPSNRILAVVPTHLFGVPADVAAVRKLFPDPRVSIVEDAAQAMGETQDGVQMGTLGDVGFFSLGRGKALSLVEGGLILTNRDDLADRLAALQAGLPRYEATGLLKIITKALVLTIFAHPRLFWIPKSLPFLRLGETLFEPDFPMRRMSPFQAGLSRHWQDTLNSLRTGRRKAVVQWITMLSGPKRDGSIRCPDKPLALLRFPLRIRDSAKRQALLHESSLHGLGIAPAYPASVDAIPELKGKISGTKTFPVAGACAQETVTLPTHRYLSELDLLRLNKIVLAVLR